jgi:hypothetical protein
MAIGAYGFQVQKDTQLNGLSTAANDEWQKLPGQGAQQEGARR